MNKIKSFGIGCLIIFLFASLGYAQRPFQASANFSLGFPQNEFKDNVDRIGLSGIGHFSYNFPRSPFSIGISFGVLVYGSETREEPFSTTIPDVMVDVTTTNMIYMCHLLFRVQPMAGRLRPYLDGFIGFNYLTTDTRIKSQKYISDRRIASTNIINDIAYSYGAGGGLMIQAYSKRGSKKGRPFAVYIDLGVRYLKGGRAEYMREGSIRLEDDRFIYDYSKSTTDLIIGHIGVSFAF